MSYHKKTSRDERAAAFLESQKLRKDIENLEDALILHSRFKAESDSSIRGMIRQEMGLTAPHWKHGGEGKLVTYRSHRDLIKQDTNQNATKSRSRKARAVKKRNTASNTGHLEMAEKMDSHSLAEMAVQRTETLARSRQSPTRKKQREELDRKQQQRHNMEIACVRTEWDAVKPYEGIRGPTFKEKKRSHVRSHSPEVKKESYEQRQTSSDSRQESLHVKEAESSSKLVRHSELDPLLLSTLKARVLAKASAKVIDRATFCSEQAGSSSHVSSSHNNTKTKMKKLPEMESYNCAPSLRNTKRFPDSYSGDPTLKNTEAERFPESYNVDSTPRKAKAERFPENYIGDPKLKKEYNSTEISKYSDSITKNSVERLRKDAAKHKIEDWMYTYSYLQNPFPDNRSKGVELVEGHSARVNENVTHVLATQNYEKTSPILQERSAVTNVWSDLNRFHFLFDADANRLQSDTTTTTTTDRQRSIGKSEGRASALSRGSSSQSCSQRKDRTDSVPNSKWTESSLPSPPIDTMFNRYYRSSQSSESKSSSPGLLPTARIHQQSTPSKAETSQSHSTRALHTRRNKEHTEHKSDIPFKDNLHILDPSKTERARNFAGSVPPQVSLAVALSLESPGVVSSSDSLLASYSSRSDTGTMNSAFLTAVSISSKLPGSSTGPPSRTFSSHPVSSEIYSVNPASPTVCNIMPTHCNTSLPSSPVVSSVYPDHLVSPSVATPLTFRTSPQPAGNDQQKFSSVIEASSSWLNTNVDPAQLKSHRPICDRGVESWLQNLGLHSVDQYVHLFAEHQMDMSSARLLTASRLREMGVHALGPIMKIMKGVEVLKRDERVSEVESETGVVDMDLLYPLGSNSKLNDSHASLLEHSTSKDTKEIVFEITDSKEHRVVIKKSDKKQAIESGKMGKLNSDNSNTQSQQNTSYSQEIRNQSRQTVLEDITGKKTHSDVDYSNLTNRSSDSQESSSHLSVKQAVFDGTSGGKMSIDIDYTNMIDRSPPMAAILPDNGTRKGQSKHSKKTPNPNRGQKKKIFSPKQKETSPGSKVTGKPPPTSRLDDGVSVAAQKFSLKQQQQLSKEQAEERIAAQHKQIRNEMAARHVQRRPSSLDRGTKRNQRSGLERSASFSSIDDVCGEESSPFKQGKQGNGQDLTLETLQEYEKQLDHLEQHNRINKIQPDRFKPEGQKGSSCLLTESVTLKSYHSDEESSSRLLSGHRRNNREKRRQRAAMGWGPKEEGEGLAFCTPLTEWTKMVATSSEGTSGMQTQQPEPTYDQSDKTQTSKMALSSWLDKNAHTRNKEIIPQVTTLPGTVTENVKESLLQTSPFAESKPASEKTVEAWDKISSQANILFSKTNTDHARAQSSAEVNAETSLDRPGVKISMSGPASDKAVVTDVGMEYGRTLKDRTRGEFPKRQHLRLTKLDLSYIYHDSMKKVELDRRDVWFSEKDVLGEDTFSQVFKGIYQGSEVAVKRLRVPLPARDKNYFAAEVSLLQELRHPHVVMLLGVCTVSDKLPLLVLELMSGGNLHSLLHDRRRSSLSHNEFYQIAHDVSAGMLYLHHHKPPVLHLDLKSRNILIGHGTRAKVGDFGFSKLKHEADVEMSRANKAHIEQPAWMAPELMTSGEITAKADVYSFGVVLWEMLTRKTPYKGCSMFQVLENVRLNKRPGIPKECPPQLSQLMQKCWAPNPAARPSFKAVLKCLEHLSDSQDLNVSGNAPPSSEDLVVTIDLSKENALGEAVDKEKRAPRIRSSDGSQLELKSVSLEESDHEEDESPVQFTEDVSVLLESHRSDCKDPILNSSSCSQPNSANINSLSVLKMTSTSPAKPATQPLQRETVNESGEEREDNCRCDSKDPIKIPDSTSQCNLVSMKETNKNPSNSETLNRLPKLSSYIEISTELKKQDSDPDLIERYLPTSRHHQSLSKFYEHQFSLPGSGKIQPLHHSLDKLKPWPSHYRDKTLSPLLSGYNQSERKWGKEQDISRSCHNFTSSGDQVQSDSIHLPSQPPKAQRAVSSIKWYAKKDVVSPPYVPSFHDVLLQHTSKCPGTNTTNVSVDMNGHFQGPNEALEISTNRTIMAQPIPTIVAQPTRTFMKSPNSAHAEPGLNFAQSLKKTVKPIGNLDQIVSRKTDTSKAFDETVGSSNKHFSHLLPQFRKSQDESDKGGNTNSSTVNQRGYTVNTNLVKLEKDELPILSEIKTGSVEVQTTDALGVEKPEPNTQDEDEICSNSATPNTQKHARPLASLSGTTLSLSPHSEQADTHLNVVTDLQKVPMSSGTSESQTSIPCTDTAKVDLHESIAALDFLPGDQIEMESNVTQGHESDSDSSSASDISEDSLSKGEKNDTVLLGLIEKNVESAIIERKSETKETGALVEPAFKNGHPEFSAIHSQTTTALHHKGRESFYLFDAERSPAPSFPLMDPWLSTETHNSLSTKLESSSDPQQSKDSPILDKSTESHTVLATENSSQTGNQKIMQTLSGSNADRSSKINLIQDFTSGDHHKSQHMSRTSVQLADYVSNKAVHKEIMHFPPTAPSLENPNHSKHSSPKHSSPRSSPCLKKRTETQLNFTASLLAEGRKLLRPVVSVPSPSKCKVSDPKSNDSFTIEASMLKAQKERLRSVVTRESSPLTKLFFAEEEESSPSVVSILKKAMNDRRYAMEDNHDSQEITSDASWSLQDEEL